jgi:hypothetical protein
VVRRQLVTRLSTAYGANLVRGDVKILADEKFGCLSGCLFSVLLFPLKLLLGWLLLVVRFKRFVDMAGRTYHAARLIDYALRAERIAPVGPYAAAHVRAAVDRVCDSADIDSVRAVFRQLFKRKAGVLKDLALLFWSALKSVRGRRNEDHVEQAVNEAKGEAAESVGGILAPLRTAMEAIPPEHFAELEAALDAELTKQHRDAGPWN